MHGEGMKYVVEVEFAEFGWTALNESAQRQGVSVEEVVRHAAMLYIASDQQGRLSHKVPADLPTEERAQARL
jgi:hypothetical protein